MASNAADPPDGGNVLKTDSAAEDSSHAEVVLLDVEDGDERFVLSQALRQFALTQRAAGGGGEDQGRADLADVGDALIRRLDAAFRAHEDDDPDQAGAGPRRRSRRRNAGTDDGPRRNTVQIKLTDQEYAEITALAEAMSCSRPRVYTAAVSSGGAVFGRMALIRQKGLLADLYGATRLLAAIGSNLNQLTRAANATGVIEERIEHTLEAVDSAVMRINVILDEADLQ